MSAVSYMQAIEKCSYEYSSTQILLPDDIAATVREMAKTIDSRDLVKVESKPHITLKYGLHTANPQPVISALGGETTIHVRLGKTSIFMANESHAKEDVVKIDVFSPQLRKLHKKLCNTLPHTATHPGYHPHITIAYVKKGTGNKYVGRSDVAGKTFSVDVVEFANRAGHKTDIPLSKAAQYLNTVQYQKRAEEFVGPSKPSAEYDFPTNFGDPTQQSPWYTRSPAVAGGGALAGSLLGGGVLAPILARLFNFDPDRARSVLGMLGLGVGIMPGVIHGLTMKKLKGSYTAPWGPPQNANEFGRFAKWTAGKPRFSVDQELWDNPKSPVQTPRERMAEVGRASGSKYLQDVAGNDAIWETDPASKSTLIPVTSKSPDLPPKKPQPSINMDKPAFDYTNNRRDPWDPEFPVSQALDEVTNNPNIPIMRKAKMRMLISEAGRVQGVGETGLASAGSLMKALPSVVAHAVPTAGGAWGVAKLLGAPRWLKNTAVGSALVYASLKGFMDKGASDERNALQEPSFLLSVFDIEE